MEAIAVPIAVEGSSLIMLYLRLSSDLFIIKSFKAII